MKKSWQRSRRSWRRLSASSRVQQARGRQLRAPAERAIGVAVQVIRRPQFFVRTGGAKFKSSSAKRVEEKRRTPTIHQLALCIQGDALVGKKTFTRRIHPAKRRRPVFIRAHRTIRRRLHEQSEIVHQARDQGKIVLGRKFGVGVIAQDGFAKQWSCSRRN